MPERHLSASKRKQQVSNLLLYLSKFFGFLRDTAVSAFNSFGFIRVCTAEPRPDFRYRSNANDGKALLCRVLTRGLAPKRKQQVSNLLFFKLYLFFYEIRPFPPSILFVCPCMCGGASAGFSLSLKCERRQSHALPRTHSRTRSKKKTAGL